MSTCIELQSYGGPEALHLVERQELVPQAGQVALRVRAAGVAYADVMMRHGKYPGAPRLPFVPGYDVMGVVQTVGEGVTDLQPGQCVVAMTKFGGYAEQVCIEAQRAIPVPPDIDPAEAVSLVLNYVSAYQMLHRTAKVRKGQSILVHSAAGGVGTALLQLARLAGVRAYGTASSKKQQVVRDYDGLPIDYRSTDFVQYLSQVEPDGLDAVFDPIGADHWLRSRQVLKKGGVLVGFGMLSDFDEDRPVGSAMRLIRRVVGLKVVTKGRRFEFFGVNFEKDPNGFREDLQAVLTLHEQGKIQPLIGRRLPLEQAPEAHRALAAGEVCGKIVLLCGAEAGPT